MPLFAEQHYNAKRAEYHGFGITINILDFAVDHVINNINHVISNSSYHGNIYKASTIYKSEQMAPLDKATWWIEHVIQNGGAHLCAHALDMPWYHYLMLDILLFVLVNIFVVTCVVFKVCMLCLHVVRKRNVDSLNNSKKGRSKKGSKSD